MKKITSYTIHETAEGERASFTYSIIDDDGNITLQNERGEVIILDEEMLAIAKKLSDFLYEKIPD